jgi:hypothetical protein
LQGDATLQPNATIEAGGVYIDNTLAMSSSASVSTNGVLQISDGVTLKLSLDAAAPGTLITLPLMTYTEVEGTFSNVQIEAGNCLSASSPTLDYGTTVLSVTVQLTSTCTTSGSSTTTASSSALSVGAIVGIAVGSAAAVVIVLVVVLSVIRHRNNVAMNQFFDRAKKQTALTD